ncbi:25731_t:CDS:2, partial [Gigaspora rosea]
VRIFWKDIIKEQVKHKLEIMAGEKSLYRRRQNKNDLIASIEYLALIPSYIEHLKCHSQVLTRFRVRDTDKSWAVEILEDLKNDDMKLDIGITSICGCALLIGKSRASIDYSVDDDSAEDINMLMNQFFMQVDLAHQITTRLIKYGHFLYQKMRIEAHGPSTCKTSDFLLTLCKIGEVFHNIITDIPQRIRSIPDDVEPDIADTVFKGKIFVAECHFFTNHRSFPEPWQILICRRQLLQKKIFLFIKRSFIATKNGYRDYLFCIANAMNLHILDQFAENIHPTNGLDSESRKILYSEICDHATCVTKQNGLKVQQLTNCKLNTFESLHLDITLITYPHEINFFLFELLTLGIFSNELDVVHFPQTLIFIEITSTIEQYLFESLSLIKYIRRQHMNEI